MEYNKLPDQISEIKRQIKRLEYQRDYTSLNHDKVIQLQETSNREFFQLGTGHLISAIEMSIENLQCELKPLVEAHETLKKIAGSLMK